MEDVKIEFKKSIKKRPGRAKIRHSSSEDEKEDEEINTLEFEKTKKLQKLRKRTAGTNIVTLALGKKVSKIEEEVLEDPFKLNSGGLVTAKNMKGYKTKQDAYDVGTQFYKETHIRDEDDEMKKFIEVEMEKIKGTDVDENEDEGPQYLSPEDAALQALPKHLTKSTFKKDQQMLSAQMLTGIPEVDLGIEVKIQNIERTERAKRDLLRKGEISLGEGVRQDKEAPIHQRFTTGGGSLGSDGRFEPNMFGSAAAQWEEQQEGNKQLLKAATGPKDAPKGEEATDDLALRKFKDLENAERLKNRPKK